MGKRKSGDYICMYWDGGPAPYELIHGHVSKDEAIATLATEDVEWPSGREGTADVSISVTHDRARWVPAPPDRRSEVDTIFICPAAGPGSFPVTLIREEESSRAPR